MNSAFRALWFVNSQVVSKYYSSKYYLKYYLKCYLKDYLRKAGERDFKISDRLSRMK